MLAATVDEAARRCGCARRCVLNSSPLRGASGRVILQECGEAAGGQPPSSASPDDNDVSALIAITGGGLVIYSMSTKTPRPASKMT
jgi:hypothetical protein